MSLAWNILQFALILMGLVLVHEWGHMVVAKRCGMRVEKFSIFFGRPLGSFTRGETTYAIGWLPLGGYVKITGMTRDEDVPPEHVHRTYYAAPVWKRVATIAAGPGVNILVAVAAFTLMFWIGVPRSMDYTPVVSAVTADSPADTIGLQPGDRITAVDGRSTADAAAVRAALAPHPDQVVDVTFVRDGRSITRRVRLDSVEENGRQVGKLGFGFQAKTGPAVSSGPVGGVTDAIDYTWFVVETTGEVIARQFQQPDPDQFNSPVGAAAVYNDVVAGEGAAAVLQFIGLISLALALFNLLPMPPLDGGHILFALVEKVRGSPVPRRVVESASLVGFAVMMMLGLVLIQNDIFNIANGTLIP